MTRMTNARLAGLTLLLYIVAGMTNLALAGRPHATAVLGVLTSFCALILGVTLYALTRDVDRDIALVGLMCRVVEAIPGPEGGSTSAIFFAVGSTAFAWLLLRGRLIPISLAWFGVAASVILVLLLFLQRGGILSDVTNWSSPVTWLLWFPMAIFEIALAVWLLVKGVAPAPARASA